MALLCRRLHCAFRRSRIALLLLALAGCMHEQTRLQCEDEADKEVAVKTIGEITGYSNADPIPVSGVGLVVGLDGTGGDAPPGDYRKMLEAQLHQQGIEEVREVLGSPNNSLVLVSSMIPPGAHVGDPLDVEVTLPPQSKTKSLRGGYLRACWLMNYDSTRNLDPNYAGPNTVKIGNKIGKAEGPVLVGFGDGDEASKLRQGHIWGGARSGIERPLALVLDSGSQRAPVAQRVADRINETFHGPSMGGLGDIASAKTSSVIYLKVPQQYRLNMARFMRVVRLIPLQETAEGRTPYRHRLAEQLLDPERTVTAALRLEALGGESIETLKRGLQSKHPLVRFCSAEALAYLDCPACGAELADLAEQQPELCAYCLTALGSLDEAVSHVELRKLLDSPTAETRYGAFVALRTLDEHDAAVHGEWLNHSFWLHCVAPDSPPLVHVSCSRRPEVVLFGDEVQFVPPFSFLAGDFTITANRDDTRCTISRFSVEHGTHRRQCSLKADEILRTLAGLGGLYPEAVELLRQADRCQCLTCAVRADALPQAASVFELTKKGNEFLKVDEEIRRARADLGATPTLYDTGTRSSPSGN